MVKPNLCIFFCNLQNVSYNEVTHISLNTALVSSRNNINIINMFPISLQANIIRNADPVLLGSILHSKHFWLPLDCSVTFMAKGSQDWLPADFLTGGAVKTGTGSRGICSTWELGRYGAMGHEIKRQRECSSEEILGDRESRGMAERSKGSAREKGWMWRNRRRKLDKCDSRENADGKAGPCSGE